MEYFTLNNGIKMPAVGFGSYNPTNAEYTDVVKRALDKGYRFIDTASLYGTEKQVGKALAQSGLKRDEYLVESKAWIDEFGYDNVMKAFDRTMERLQLEYLDIYIIHWPRAYEVYNGVPGHDMGQNVLPYDTSKDWKELLLETYRAYEELYEKKLIRGIGLSNFLPHHLMYVLDICKVKPVTNQLELHIGYNQDVARQFCKDNGIVCQAWSPLARGGLIEDGFLKTMADKYGVSVAQIALRFLYQSGSVVLPKSTIDEEQQMNLDIFNFELSQEDYYLIACMVPAFWCKEHPDFRIPNFTSNKTV